MISQNLIVESTKDLHHSEEFVLVVDDEIDICYLISGILKQRNLPSGYANSILDAKAVLGSRSPSLLFLDNRLPDGLGLNFISFVKQTCPHTKIVMITAHDDASEKAQAYKEGADLFLGKPLNRDIINQAIDRLVYNIL